MTAATPPLLELAGVSKDYRGLRPLRIQSLSLDAGDQLAILGFDQPMAETFVNVVTGATVPEQGEVRVFGRATTAITDSADWLAVVDRFGIVSVRAVLLEQLTVVQNLSMPFTLEVEPPAPDVRVRAEALAREVGIPSVAWERPVSELDPDGHARIRLARALALDPAVVILEHASAGVERVHTADFGAAIRSVLATRRVAAIALTADNAFARAVAPRVLTLDPATGRLTERRFGWF